MRKLKLFKPATLIAALLFFISSSFAQNKSVSGIVTDQDGKPVSGVNITVKRGRMGTQTDANGSYQLNVPENATLVFSSVGFGTTEMSAKGKSTVNASIASVSTTVSEVVVVGYGTARRRDLTGSVSSVNEKNFNKGTYTSADQLIQGKVAGVQVSNNSGQPGGGSTVKIRGNSAITGSGQPLYVVDGVPLDGRSARPGLGDIGLGGSNPGSNPLNFINPSDIASIDILKDASATAIYGSRAAYGVVLVTTKRGQSGQTKIDFGASYGFAKVAHKIKVLDASQFKQALTYYSVGNSNDKGSSVDAFDAITRTANVQNYNIGISGGTENGRYRLSFGALDQDGIVKKTGITKYTANLNANFKFLDSKKLGVDINIIPSQYTEHIAPISNNAGSRGSLIGNALQWNPTEKLLIPRAGKSDSLNIVRGGDLINPLALQEAYNDKSTVTTILANISPYFKFTKELEYRFLYSINYGTGIRRTSIQQFMNFNDVLDKGRARIAQEELSTEQFTHTLNFSKQFTSNISMTALAGFEYLKYKHNGSDINGYGQTAFGGFGSYGLDYTNYIQFSDPTNRGAGSFVDPSYELQSYFGQVSFNYADKYLLKGSLRRDGSSKFGINNKYGNFPSFSAAWVVSKESFFNVAAINSLKIRGGWGKTGNQEFPSGSAVKRYSFGTNGLFQNNEANPNLKWQSDRQYNFGIDMSLLKNRITFTADYFNKRTTDLLFPSEPPQPAAGGGTIKWVNLDGNIDNKGFEFSVNAAIIDQQDLHWDLAVNSTFQKNIVSGLNTSINTGTLDGQGVSGTTVEVIRNGLPINAFVTKRFTGFDKASGIAIYPDGDKLSYIGSPNPTTLFGLSTTLRYKKLSLNANLSGSFGNLLYNNTLNNVINVGSLNNGKNIALSVYQDPVKESFANPVTASSRFIQKGDYVKMTNATLSYAVGNLGSIFKGANVYVTGQNLFTITKFTGFDPEVNVDKNANGVPSVGIEYIPYPSARTITFGINFSL